MRLRIIIPALSMLLAGCGAVRLDPAWLDTRTVRAVSDTGKTVAIRDGMVFYDASPATRGIRFPPGTYALEAEDDAYWYFRSPAPLEFRTFKNGNLADGRNIAGGLMVAKHFSLIPGAGYIDDEGMKKLAVWKLGNEWLRTEGKYWTKSF